jgi:hypothetical protein
VSDLAVAIFMNLCKRKGIFGVEYYNLGTLISLIAKEAEINVEGVQEFLN